MRKILFLLIPILCVVACSRKDDSALRLNDLEYFERQGVNVLVYVILISGMTVSETNAIFMNGATFSGTPMSRTV